MCGWYCYADCQLKWSNGMVMDRSWWVYFDFAESQCYAYGHRNLFIIGKCVW